MILKNSNIEYYNVDQKWLNEMLCDIYNEESKLLYFFTGSMEFGFFNEDSDYDIVMTINSWEKFKEVLNSKNVNLENYIMSGYSDDDTTINIWSIKFKLMDPEIIMNFIIMDEEEYKVWLLVTKIIKKLIKSTLGLDSLFKIKDIRVKVFEFFKDLIRENYDSLRIKDERV